MKKSKIRKLEAWLTFFLKFLNLILLSIYEKPRAELWVTLSSLHYQSFCMCMRLGTGDKYTHPWYGSLVDAQAFISNCHIFHRLSSLLVWCTVHIIWAYSLWNMIILQKGTYLKLKLVLVVHLFSLNERKKTLEHVLR